MNTLSPPDCSLTQFDDPQANSILEETITHLPSYTEIANMPAGLQEEVRRMALERLQRLFYGRVVSWVVANRKVADGHVVSREVLTDILVRSEPFSRMARDAVSRMAELGKTVSYTMNEEILESGGVLVLHEGTVFSSVSDTSNTRMKFRHPAVVGAERVVVDDIDGLKYHAGSTVVRGTLISRRAVLKHFEQQPMWSTLLPIRHKYISQKLRVDHETLRKCCLFETLTDAQLSAVEFRLELRTYKVGQTILQDGASLQGNNGTPIREMIFLVKGEASASNSNDHKKTFPLTAGQCFGEMGLIFSEQRTANLKAVTLCDVWALTHSTLKSLMSVDSELSYRIHHAAHIQRLKFLAGPGKETMKTIHELKTLLKKAPMLRDLNAPDECFSELCEQMVPTVFVPNQQVVSAVDICDALLILSRGRAIVRQNLVLEQAYIEPGDTIGYTCLVDHRWLFPVSAVITSDVWKLSQKSLHNTLKKYGLLKAAGALTRKLLQSSGGAARVLRTETDPPLLHPIKGLPEDIGHVMSYSVKPPSSPPPKVLSSLAGLEKKFDLGIDFGTPKKPTVPRVVPVPPSAIPLVPMPPSVSRGMRSKEKPRHSKYTTPPSALTSGWMLSSSTNRRLVSLPNKYLRDAKKFGIITPPRKKKSQRLVLPTLASIPSGSGKVFTADSLVSAPPPLPWELGLREAGQVK
eukprot:TRINITY_DN13576_c0_g2_i1.p1 TRINITY_DN13576_c0_g2~~TRINITY_DN13576_c0_g2_i1.p1  ORF type:complete len:691 (+),score=108.53 TRINITY_DN13576_c0_g2_i1:106-2178(+)